MTEHIKTNDTVYFLANFYHPSSGFSYDADETPHWYVHESGATPILNGDMTARSDMVGSYWGSFVASDGNGFTPHLFYDVSISGTVQGISGFSSIKEFVLDDIVDSNVVQVSGDYVHLDDFGGSTSGLTAEDVRTEIDANSVMLSSISGDIISVKEKTDYLPSITPGASGGLLIAGTNEPVLIRGSGNALTLQSIGLNGKGLEVIGNVAAPAAKFSSGSHFMEFAIELNGQQGSIAELENVITAIGTPQHTDLATDNIQLHNELMQVSGVLVNRTLPSGDYLSNTVNTDIYFAAIRYVSDGTNNADEFVVHWFKNDQPVTSGELTDPAISVYNTFNGNSLIINQSMNYASSNLGVVRYNETPRVLASGEPYLVETSGTIDSLSRTWRSIVGLDLL